MSNGNNKEMMTSLRLTSSEKDALRRLAHNKGQKSINGLIRMIARAKKVTIET